MTRVSGSGAANGEVELRVRNFGGVFRTRQIIGINTASSPFYRPFQAPEQIPAKADVALFAAADVSSDIAAGFDLVLIRQ